MEEKTKVPTAEKIVKEIKRRTRRKFTAEEKIKIVLEALRGEVSELRRMNDLLKREVGELYIENKELKKTVNGFESEGM